MTYRNLVVRQFGGPGLLRAAENELQPPRQGEARIRVLAASVSRPAVTVRRADRLIPVPAPLDPAQAVTLILNCIVAHQTMHGQARVNAADKVLIIGANGGIGMALLQLGQLAGRKCMPLPQTANTPF